MVMSFFFLLFINIFSCALVSITIYNIFCVSTVHASNVFTIGLYNVSFSVLNIYYIDYDFIYLNLTKCYSMFEFDFGTIQNSLYIDYSIYMMYWYCIDFKNFIHFSDYIISSETMLIRFVTRTVTETVIQFDCLQDYVYVVPEETTLVFFRVYNMSTSSISCLTVYLIYPSKLIPYIKKIQCFCFDTLLVLANESVELPILFYVSPAFFMEYSYNGSIFFLYILISMTNL